MKNPTLLIAVAGVSVSLVALAKADELRFTTLPPAVQTSVIKETRITSPSRLYASSRILEEYMQLL